VTTGVGRDATPGLVLQGVDAFGRLSLGEGVVHGRIGLVAQRLEIGALRAALST
jgi:hypothetical protein